MVRVATLALMLALGLAAPASAHRDERAPIVHRIDHLRSQTNDLRRQAGLKPLRPHFRYRQVADPAYRLSALAFWGQRLEEARRLFPKPGSVWARLAECESNGDWDYNGSDIFDGGLQFHPGTWATYRLPGYPRFAWQAAPMQQIAVARRVLRAEGWNAWPVCSRVIGVA